MKFKNNAGCDRCKTKILEKMNTTFPDAQWNLDLENADKILEVHGMPENAEKAAQVVKALEETGFKGSWIEQ